MDAMEKWRKPFLYVLAERLASLASRSTLFCERPINSFNGHGTEQKSLQLFFVVRVSNCRQELTYVVKNTRVRTKKDSYPDHFQAKTVPTSYRTPKSVRNLPILTPQNIYYYIDNINVPNKLHCLIRKKNRSAMNRATYIAKFV